MSDPFRFNSPTRRSRFRAQGRSRPGSYSPDTGAGEEEPGEEVAASEQTGEALHDPYAPVEGEEMPLEELPGAGVEPETDQAPAAEEDALPAGLRLTRDPDQVAARRGLSAGLATGLVLAGLALGGTAGYFFGHAHGLDSARSPVPFAVAKSKIPVGIDRETLTQIDGAFDDTKHGKYADARNEFAALYTAHPEWPSLEIEAARAALYERDFQGVQTLLKNASQDHPLADATLLGALVHLTAEEYDQADASFAAAAATDPARADIYYFWGENLRREGKPLQAMEKFKAALIRNQYENVEPLYLVKYWMSVVQADQEGPTGEGAKIDAVLASPHPSSAALFAAAARALKTGNYKAAGDFIGKAQAITDPTVFNVIMRDPTFMDANLRPELERFYKQGNS